MRFKTLVVERQNAIAILRVNRPNVFNALNQLVFKGLSLAFEEMGK